MWNLAAPGTMGLARQDGVLGCGDRRDSVSGWSPVFRTGPVDCADAGATSSDEVIRVRTNEPDPASGGLETVTTLEDLGRFLRELRDKRHVTQEGLTAHTGRKIARSRISEIENARRDPVTERELRVYLTGLKCAVRDIEQVVTVLTRCTATPARESRGDPDASGPAATYADPAGLEGIDDSLASLKEKSDDDSAAAAGKRNSGWKFGVAAVASVIIVIVCVALFHANTLRQNHPSTQSNGLGGASALNHSPFPTPSSTGPSTQKPPPPTPSSAGLGASPGTQNPLAPPPSVAPQRPTLYARQPASQAPAPQAP
jgi:transcriptional regulator with XRE-family HTH domain